jgi:hypothetical protein
MEDKAAVVLLVSSCLDIDRIDAMTALGEKIEPDYFAFEESIHEWKEVGTAREVARDGTDGQIDLGDKDGEKAAVEGNERIIEHGPELWCEIVDIVSGQVYG